jgi:hypothetical protein
MDVRNWEFLAPQLDQFTAISNELASSGSGERIAYTAFFWTLLQYHGSDEGGDYTRAAMSLPDHLLQGHRETVEAISADLDKWLRAQSPDSHPQYTDLRRVVDVGLQATTSPIFEPRSSRF